MADKRMFAKSIVLSDAFLDLPVSARCLYFTLGMLADDDGFCANPRSIMRQCGASNDDMKVLVARKFVLTFERNDNFIVVIKHWHMNNYIRKDTYRETKYKEFMRELYYDENRSYSLNPGDGHYPCIADRNISPVTEPSQLRDEAVTEPSRNRDESLTQYSIDKNSKEKDSIDQDRIGKGGYGGKNLEDAPVLDGLLDDNRLELIKKHAYNVRTFMNHGWPTDGMFTLAANDGISRAEIEEYLRREGTA